MLFGEALTKLQTRKAEGMRLTRWKEDVVIKIHYPDKDSKMTHPYLYVKSRYGCVPWKETVVEMFDDGWVLVNEIKEDKSTENVFTEDDILKSKLFYNLLKYNIDTVDIINYNWDDEFSRGRLRSAIKTFSHKLNDIIDWNNLTEDTMDLFKFYKVSKQDINIFADRIMTDGYLSNEEKVARFEKLKNIVKLRLIPAYLADAIPNGIELITIDGDIIIHDSKNFNRDNKNGYLTFGLNPKEEENA